MEEELEARVEEELEARVEEELEARVEEELEALVAILGSALEIKEGRRRCKVKVEVRLEQGRRAVLLLKQEVQKLDLEYLPPVLLHIHMPSSYPCSCPPEVELEIGWLGEEERERLMASLHQVLRRRRRRRSRSRCRNKSSS